MPAIPGVITIRANNVIIDTPLEKVWRAFVTLRNYPAWNPDLHFKQMIFVI